MLNYVKIILDMIIGVTGTLSSGKDTVAKYIEGKGFVHFSLADILRKFADERNIPRTRDSLRELADQMVREVGDDYLIAQALEYIKKDPEKDYIISSIRRPVEVEKLKNFGNFFLIAVDADPKIRYDRSINRAREKEADYSFEEFIAKEKAEKSGTGSQNLDACKSMANFIVLNNQTPKELYAKVDQILKEKDWKKSTKGQSKNKKTKRH
jgi:dephospho-CoA kinase